MLRSKGMSGLDSDVFFMLLYYAHIFQVPNVFDTDSGNKRCRLNISGIACELVTNTASIS